MLYYIQQNERGFITMTTIYDASTLRQITHEACMAEYTYIKDKYVPAVLDKINDANFAAANAGLQLAEHNFNLSCMGLTTEEAQGYFRVGLKSELERLGFKLKIELFNNGMMKVTCKW